MEARIKTIISEMTLEEKAALCSGRDFWHMKALERFDLPAIMVADGPHGLRKQSMDGDNLGLNVSLPATCFPTAVTLASSWDKTLLFEVGEALGDTCIEEKVSVLLGPGANIKRSPLCGRNFEYFSEDPLLTGEMASAFINGVQSKGIGTSLKHFAVNNQEAYRMTIDALVDERALREIYLTGFEMAVKAAQPWTVMCSYNKINGTYGSEHPILLGQILKREWGHEGLVVTDWGAMNQRVDSLKAGLELEMPTSFGANDAAIVSAIQSGDLPLEVLDGAVERLLKLILKSQEALQKTQPYNREAQHQLARKAAADSMVLLKNSDGILPFDTNGKRIGIVGAFAKTPRFQGAGSSLVNPTKLDTAYEALQLRMSEAPHYAPGYDLIKDEVNEALIREACKLAQSVDHLVVMVGLTDAYESEGFDRSHMRLPKAQDQLVTEILKVKPNAVIVLSNGSPVELPWIDEAKAVLEAYLPGQAGGTALCDVLFGDVNPSGKLAESFPFQLKDTPCNSCFPMGPKAVAYRESLYVGYRFYDTADVPVCFPFGHGLSYTQFEYSNCQLDRQRIRDHESVTVTVEVKNIGNRSGKEIVQLYVSDVESSIFRPSKTLQGFDKISLEPGESKVVSFKLGKRAFAYYNIQLKDWQVETGDFDILIGASSKDIRQKTVVHVTSTVIFDEIQNDKRGFLDAYYDLKAGWIPSKEAFEKLFGSSEPKQDVVKKGSFHLNSTIDEIRMTTTGNLIYKIIMREVDKKFSEVEEKQKAMALAMVGEMPLRNFPMMTEGKFTRSKVQGLIDVLNGKTLKGLIKIIKK